MATKERAASGKLPLDLGKKGVYCSDTPCGARSSCAFPSVKALRTASAGAQRIYPITPANQANTLSNIRHDSLTMDEIRVSVKQEADWLSICFAVESRGASYLYRVVVKKRLMS